MAMAPERTETSVVAAHIARSAARLFAERGYDATPVRAIVEAAGVTKPTLYYHFGSKEGLAQALLSAPLARLNAELRSILEGPGAAVAKLEAMAEAHFTFVRVDPDRARLLFAIFFGPLNNGLASELAACGEGLCGHDHAAAKLLTEAGVIDGARAGDFAMAMHALIVDRIMTFLYHGGDLGPDLARRLVGDALWGFARADSRPSGGQTP